MSEQGVHEGTEHAPLGGLLSPARYPFCTDDCCARQDSNTIIMFSDDTTVEGLITDNDETAYREEVRDLSGCARITTYPSS